MVDILIEAPLLPRGKGRPRASVVAGHAHIHTPAETRKWEAMLAELAREQLPAEVLESPVRVDVLAVEARPQRLLAAWVRPRPEGWHEDGTRGGCLREDPGLLWRPGKPDADNVRKAVLDALSTFWRDDKQVVRGDTLSAWAELRGRARVVVRIRTDIGDVTEAARRLGLVA